MSDKPIFFYATGTAFTPTVVWEDGKLRLDAVGIGADGTLTATIAGLNGRTAPFSGGITNDPFPVLMNPDLWESIKVPYPASAFPMDQSIQSGVDWLMSTITTKLPPGRPWAIGGTSQGAAVCSRIYEEVRGGALTAWADSFLCGVCFGNPMRQVNFTNPWSSYSGAFDVPGSTTGGHGSFPASWRLSGCDPDNWIEFTNPCEVITGVGDSPVGSWWQASNGAFLLQTVVTPGSPGSLVFNLGTFLLGVGSSLLSQGLPFLPNFLNEISKCTDPSNPGYIGPGPVTDAAGNTAQLAGGGHVIYATNPPPGWTGPETAYQLAFRHLDSLAMEWATSPTVLPPSSTLAGWSTTLIPPAT